MSKAVMLKNLGGGIETFSFDEGIYDTAENILQLIKNKITNYDGISGFVGTWNDNSHSDTSTPSICAFKRAKMYGDDVAYFMGFTYGFGADRVTTIEAHSGKMVYVAAGATFQVTRP